MIHSLKTHSTFEYQRCLGKMMYNEPGRQKLGSLQALSADAAQHANELYSDLLHA